jgi:single-strand DNA-binding protein
MNIGIIMGRLTKDPEIKTGKKQDGTETKVARFTVAVDGTKKDDTDFIPVVAFGKKAEVIEKFFKKGNKILLKGRIKTGSYTNKEGQKVYTTDIWLEELDFCESKKSDAQPQQDDGFLDVPDNLDETLPF